MEKTNSLVLFYKYEILKDDETKAVIEIVNNMWTHEVVTIGGVIDFKSKISNTIKFITQSIYSHTNFALIKQNKIIKTVGSEQGGIIPVLYSDPFSDRHFYYITKEIDLDLVTNNFNFDYSQGVFDKIFKSKTTGYLSYKFKHYCYIRLKNYFGEVNDKIISKISENDIDKIIKNKIGLETIIKASPSFYDPSIDMKLIERQIENFLKYRKGVMNSNDKQSKGPNLNTMYSKFLKEFIILGIIEHIIGKVGDEYDTEGTLSVWKHSWEYTQIEDKDEFCSEFITDCLLYAGIYPFDIESKSPASVSPGDIMDGNLIFKKGKSKIFNINKGNIIKLHPGKCESFKDIILHRENGKIYFIIKKFSIHLLAMLIKIILNYWMQILLVITCYYIIKTII